MHPTDRQLAIVLALQEQGWRRAADLAAALEVSTRTIYRDMEALMVAGVPVVAVPGQGYRLDEGYLLPPIKFATDEAIVLLLGTGLADEYLGVDYQPAVRAARARLEAVLPDRLLGEVTALQKSMRFVPVNAFDNPEEQQALHDLREAMAGQQAVHFDYPLQRGKPSKACTVNPYGLVHLGEAWHLVGYCHDQQCVCHFRLSQMQALDVLSETFERPEGYAAPTHRFEEQRDVVVRVRFDQTVARWVEAAPSFYMDTTEMRPEGLYVTLKVQRETEVLPWLLSWGGHAQVLEPASLQRRLAQEAEKIATRYQTEPMLLS